jgi:hypothetical protein
MKHKIFNYIALTLFSLLAGFLIWGLINLLSNFTIQANGWLTFLSVLAPHVLSLGYVGFYMIKLIINIRQNKKTI